jgi:hypothetical protein
VDEDDAAAETRRRTTLPPLRKRGHSKASRDENPQVVVGLALTRDGLPVRSWVFPGNTMDATTVAQVKEELRGWKLGRAIFVGDAGMDSATNRHKLAKGLGHSILAMPAPRSHTSTSNANTRRSRRAPVHRRGDRTPASGSSEVVSARVSRPTIADRHSARGARSPRRGHQRSKTLEQLQRLQHERLDPSPQGRRNR